MFTYHSNNGICTIFYEKEIIVMKIPYNSDEAFYTKSEAEAFAAGVCDRMNAYHNNRTIV